MERKQELEEFVGLLNALAKKYNVSLGIQVIDLTPKEETKEVKEEKNEA